MFELDLKSRKTIYEQVIDNFKKLIINGVLKGDDKLPSIRDVSKMLTVNPNTVQKAYRELERQGYIYTLSGLGSFVSSSLDIKVDEQKLSSVKHDLISIINELLFMGLEKNEIQDIFSQCISEGGAVR